LADLPHEITHGQCRYVFNRGGDGRLAMTVFRGAERIHGYAVNETPRKLDFFTNIILDSFRPDATFMTLLRVVRYFDGHSVELKNNVVTWHSANESRTTQLRSTRELRAVFNEELQMPRCPVERVAKVLERLTGQSFFEMGEGDLFG
jgi:arylamine N-acetyltransferase